jgi:hypothetical protein
MRQEGESTFSPFIDEKRRTTKYTKERRRKKQRKQRRNTKTDSLDIRNSLLKVSLHFQACGSSLVKSQMLQHIVMMIISIAKGCFSSLNVSGGSLRFQPSWD